VLIETPKKASGTHIGEKAWLFAHRDDALDDSTYQEEALVTRVIWDSAASGKCQTAEFLGVIWQSHNHLTDRIKIS
jgi:hypothetical protein